MNTGDVPRLEIASLEGVEGEFSRGDFRHARTYLRDALGWHLKNEDELNYRKDVLEKYADCDEDIPTYVATLAALTNDQVCWNKIARDYGYRMPPDSGYFAYGCLNQANLSSEVKSAWFHLIEFSAAKGHSESVEIVRQRKSVFLKIRGLFVRHKSD